MDEKVKSGIILCLSLSKHKQEMWNFISYLEKVRNNLSVFKSFSRNFVVEIPHLSYDVNKTLH